MGRSDLDSSCILLYNQQLSEAGKARLQIIRETEDGFKIAEEDLNLRGAGEILGVRQSGLPAFRFVQLPEHRDVMTQAYDDARLVIHRSPDLSDSRGQALRTLLHLFGYNDSPNVQNSV